MRAGQTGAGYRSPVGRFDEVTPKQNKKKLIRGTSWQAERELGYHSPAHYLTVVTSVQSVCLSVSRQDYTKSTRVIPTTFGGRLMEVEVQAPP